jgi:hypothetical protein
MKPTFTRLTDPLDCEMPDTGNGGYLKMLQTIIKSDDE